MDSAFRVSVETDAESHIMSLETEHTKQMQEKTVNTSVLATTAREETTKDANLDSKVSDEPVVGHDLAGAKRQAVSGDASQEHAGAPGKWDRVPVPLDGGFGWVIVACASLLSTILLW